jgi:hypothetical protein
MSLSHTGTYLHPSIIIVRRSGNVEIVIHARLIDKC